MSLLSLRLSLQILHNTVILKRHQMSLAVAPGSDAPISAQATEEERKLLLRKAYLRWFAQLAASQLPFAGCTFILNILAVDACFLVGRLLVKLRQIEIFINFGAENDELDQTIANHSENKIHSIRI